MILGFGLIVIGYAVFYWGLHHFPGVDCPGDDSSKCRHSLMTLLGMDLFGIKQGTPVQFG